MKRFFLDNVPLKVLSLFLALILFVLVREDRIKEFEIEVPVGIEHTPEDQVFIGEMPRSIRVALRGRWSRILRAIEHRHTPYLIDLRGKKDGDIVFFDADVLQRKIDPHGPTVVSVTPPSTTIRLEARVRKEVRVRPDLIGETARGYLLRRDAIEIEPEFVTISGAVSSVREVGEIVTAPIHIGGIARSVERDVGLTPPNHPFLTMDATRVRVTIPVEEVTQALLLPAVPIQIRDCQQLRSCDVRPNHAPVQLLGPMLRLERIQKEGGVGLLWIEAAELSVRGGVYEDVPVQIDMPDGVVVTPTTTNARLEVQELQPAPPPGPDVVGGDTADVETAVGADDAAPPQEGTE